MAAEGIGTPAGDGRERGVIHDIGYRHYDGPRLGRGYVQRSLFTETLRGSYGLGRAARTKVVPMLLLAAMCVPALVLVVVATVTGGGLPVGVAVGAGAAVSRVRTPGTTSYTSAAA